MTTDLRVGVQPTETPCLNSLLPQVTNEVMDALLKEVLDCENDEKKLAVIFESRIEQFKRENTNLFFRLRAQTTPEQLGWIVYVYSALATQNQRDMRYPA